MAEEIKTEVEKQVDTAVSETSSIIAKADAAAARMEAANKKAEELLIRSEAIASRMMLSGKAEAGSAKTPQQQQAEEVDAKVKETLKKYGKG